MSRRPGFWSAWLRSPSVSPVLVAQAAREGELPQGGSHLADFLSGWLDRVNAARLAHRHRLGWRNSSACVAQMSWPSGAESTPVVLSDEDLAAVKALVAACPTTDALAPLPGARFGALELAFRIRDTALLDALLPVLPNPSAVRLPWRYRDKPKQDWLGYAAASAPGLLERLLAATAWPQDQRDRALHACTSLHNALVLASAGARPDVGPRPAAATWLAAPRFVCRLEQAPAAAAAFGLAGFQVWAVRAFPRSWLQGRLSEFRVYGQYARQALAAQAWTPMEVWASPWAKVPGHATRQPFIAHVARLRAMETGPLISAQGLLAVVPAPPDLWRRAELAGPLALSVLTELPDRGVHAGRSARAARWAWARWLRSSSPAPSGVVEKSLGVFCASLSTWRSTRRAAQNAVEKAWKHSVEQGQGGTAAWLTAAEALAGAGLVVGPSLTMPASRKWFEAAKLELSAGEAARLCVVWSLLRSAAEPPSVNEAALFRPVFATQEWHEALSSLSTPGLEKVSRWWEPSFGPHALSWRLNRSVPAPAAPSSPRQRL